jgi:hypothetical protein
MIGAPGLLGPRYRRRSMGMRLLGVTVVTTVFAASAVGQDKAASGQKPSDTTTTAKQTVQAADQAETQPAGIGMAALQNAAEADKYLFIFFHKDNGEPMQKLRVVFDAAMEQVADKAMPVVVDINDPREKEFVDKFKVSRAPMPFVFSVAPNGAIIGSFRLQFNEQQLLDAFAGPGMETSLKALQERKYVLLCVQNGETQFNDEAMQGVRDFVADPRYARSTEIVTVDPSDAKEVDFLTQLGLASSAPEAVTLLLVPPGKVMGTFTGATDKNTLLAAVTKRKSGGCCPGASDKSTCGK